KLLEAGTVEGCYMNLFKGAVDVPPLFIGQLVHVILRNILEGCDDPLQLRAAELFFREQKATLRDGHLLLADSETLEIHAAGSRSSRSSSTIRQRCGPTSQAVSSTSACAPTNMSSCA